MSRNWNLIGRLAGHIDQPTARAHFDCSEEEIRYTLGFMRRERLVVRAAAELTAEDLEALARTGAHSSRDGYHYLDTSESRGRRGGIATPLFSTLALTAKGRDVARIATLPEIDMARVVDPRSRQPFRLSDG